MSQSTADIVREYVNAVGRHDLGTVAELLVDEPEFRTGALVSRTKPEFLAGYERLLPVLVRNDIRELVVDDDSAAVFYDFVTDTAAGAVACAEIIRMSGDKIAAVELIFDRSHWAAVLDELGRRS